MSQSDVPFENRVDEYWDWFSVSIFLLVSVDLLTTLGATAKYGLEAEANPFMVWLIAQGPLILIAINLLAVVGAVYAFSGVIEAVELAPAPYDRYLEVGVELWLGLLLAVGFFIFANNLAVIVWGQSLI